MPSANSLVDQRRTNALISAAIVVGGLYVGRDILLPFALAILLSFLLAPLADRLERAGVGRIPSVVGLVGFAFVGFVFLAAVLAHQVYDLAYRLPDYKENILQKVQTFQGDGSGVTSRVTEFLEEMRLKLSMPPDGETENSIHVSDGENAETAVTENESSLDPNSVRTLSNPVRVEVVESLTAKQIAESVLGPVVSPLASGAMVLIFVVFMLLRREDLRNRFIHLIGGEQLNFTTQAIDDAAYRVGRYLLMQLIINAAYGLVISAGLALIGLPNALLWGALTAMLRFVPYIGPWIGALMPLAISLAVFDGWARPLFVLSLFMINEMLSNNVIEPWLYGSSTGISTIGILISAVFWTWIWGPIGLVMATPLTVCLTVLGRYVPDLAFFNTLLSDEEVLAPHSRLYQRMLAMDPEEALEVAEDFLTDGSIDSLYDTVLLPALGLAEQDRHRGELDDAKQQFVQQTMGEMVEDFGSQLLQADAEGEAAAVVVPGDAVRVLCLPARDSADELACVMMVQLLGRRRISASALSQRALSGEMVEQVQAEATTVVCISALPPFAATHASYLCKRLRARSKTLKIVVGLWQAGTVTKKAHQRLAQSGADKIVTTLAEGVSELERHSHQASLARTQTALPARE